MDKELITKICGPIPENFVKANPQDSNFIFNNDPNFPALNLYDFFGRSATVNSFTECFYYVELGFEPNKTTIFDIGIYLLGVIFLGFSIFKIIKNNLTGRAFNLIGRTLKSLTSDQNIKKLSNHLVNKKLIVFFTSVFLIVQNFFLYDYIRTKSLRIPSFIDEYITLTSNVNFFKDLNFNAGGFIGGNYSVQITSGPISAIGSVIGWNFTDKLIISRISNFIWIYILQLIFIILIIKIFKSDYKFLILISGLSLILIPWWQGSLYSLGEIPSSILFINAIFLFSRLRKFSLVLFSISIFYGKLLNLVPFVGFYIVVMIYEKKIRNILKDLIIFLLPFFPWLLLVNFRYENGTVFNYLNDQYLFIINHQSSGVSESSTGFIEEFINKINISEFITWNLYDKLRLLIVPLLFMLLLYKNKKNIDNFFGKITIPLITSSLFIYLWFWVLNSTKWMRHTQHFTVPIIVTILYLINFDIIKKKIDLIFILSILGLFINNNKNLIFILIFLSILIVYMSKESIKNILIKIILIAFIFIDISIPYFEKDRAGTLSNIIEECKVELQSSECRTAYLDG